MAGLSGGSGLYGGTGLARGHGGLWSGASGFHSAPSGAPAPSIILSASTVPEDSSIGTTIGALSIINHPSGGSGWTFAKTADPDSKFAVSGANLNTAAALDHEAAASHSVTITASKSGEDNLVRTFSITVTNVPEEHLDALTLSSTSFVVGTPSSGTIDGATAGSTIVASGLPTGLTIDGAARTWAWDGTGSVSTGDLTLTETHPDADNSPRASVIGWSIADTPPVPDGALIDDDGAYLLDDDNNYLIMEPA